MKTYTQFNYNWLFGDYFAKVSNQAKLYYVALNFYADRGFVPNPKRVLDSLGYDISVYYELVKNGELLVLPDRCEVFITSYYIHNNKFNNMEWLKSPFSVYWRGKLYIKKNGVATFNPQGLQTLEKEPLADVETPSIEELNEIASVDVYSTDDEWDSLMKEAEQLRGKK